MSTTRLCIQSWLVMSKHGREGNSIIASIFHFHTDAAQRTPLKTKAQKSSSTNDSGDDSDHDETESSEESARKASRTIVSMRRPSVMAAALKAHHYGSFYLRMGAVGK